MIFFCEHFLSDKIKGNLIARRHLISAAVSAELGLVKPEKE